MFRVEIYFLNLLFAYIYWVFFAEAMDRIHRLGQYRPVEAIKIVVEDSIESRIVQVRNPNTAQSF